MQTFGGVGGGEMFSLMLRCILDII